MDGGLPKGGGGLGQFADVRGVGAWQQKGGLIPQCFVMTG